MEHRQGSDGADWGPGTRAVHAGVPEARQGAPLLPGPQFAAPFHLAGDADAAEYGYARYANPTWTHLERALGDLEGGEALAFASGMAAVTAAVLPFLGPGDVLVAPRDGYPGIRSLAAGTLERLGVTVRYVATSTEELVAAAEGARVVWVETPSNPWLDLCDIAQVAAAARSAGALLAVDNTLPTPLGQRPLELGADFSVVAVTKSAAGHSDLLLGYVATRDAELRERVLKWRSDSGGIPGPFEAWLAHRSLATLDLRLERQSGNALELARMLEARGDVADVRHPGLESHPQHALAARQMRRSGPLVGFSLPDAARAQSFLGACELVAEATSFGGIHSTAERRARWGTDAVPEGFVRLSAGCEDAEDLLADVARALDAARR